MPKLLVGVDDGNRNLKDRPFADTGTGLAISQDWTNRAFQGGDRRDHDPATLLARGGADQHPHLQQGRSTPCGGLRLARRHHTLRAEQLTQRPKVGAKTPTVAPCNASRIIASGVLLHRPMPGTPGREKCFARAHRQTIPEAFPDPQQTGCEPRDSHFFTTMLSGLAPTIRVNECFDSKSNSLHSSFAISSEFHNIGSQAFVKVRK